MQSNHDCVLDTSLTALPNELLTLVVTELASISTLCNLARCSRQLYLCTIPHLYGHITLQEDGEQQDERLVMLTTSLLRRPDLAKLVRQFSLHVAEPKERKPEDIIDPKYVKIDGVVATAVDPSGLSQEEVINCLGQYDHFHISRHDFILSFLLPSMLNVEKLVLDVHINHDSHFLDEAIRNAVARERPLDTQQPFGALTVLDLSPHDKHCARKLNFMGSLLRLPAIREISVHLGKGEPLPRAYLEDDDFDLENFPERTVKELARYSSPLTSLDIATYDMPPVDLHYILRVPIALKHFSFMVCSSFCYCDCYIIQVALDSQKDCLESITIYDHISLRSEIEEGHWFMEMGPLTRFSVLKVFKTAALFLTKTIHGSERESLLSIFPPSLETLHLTRFQSNFNNLLEALEHLLAYKSAQHIPSLANLILEETVSGDAPPTRLNDVLWGNTQESAIEKLSEVAKSQDVVFEVIEGVTC
ncbi:hypothetical protein MMC22_010046 [Lobaria immixta]|nr:hypothetical protein [Lobaria immixta]